MAVVTLAAFPVSRPRPHVRAYVITSSGVTDSCSCRHRSRSATLRRRHAQRRVPGKGRRCTTASAEVSIPVSLANVVYVIELYRKGHQNVFTLTYSYMLIWIH